MRLDSGGTATTGSTWLWDRLRAFLVACLRLELGEIVGLTESGGVGGEVGGSVTSEMGERAVRSTVESGRSAITLQPLSDTEQRTLVLFIIRFHENWMQRFSPSRWNLELDN